ncbi:hypothetical protein B0H10DRAFT_1971905 [Mycena sp. CBHHK59/15]|nr:hypothetical protein B0H10DRAFT_1971905 [Mycena sp. CBHHK59/15]
MFEKQQAAAKVLWDQDHFETLVAKWVAACDQPFVTVMREEFCEMLEYTHHHSPTPLKIPSPDSVKGNIMRMSSEMVNKLKAIFKRLETRDATNQRLQKVEGPCQVGIPLVQKSEQDSP